jgi:protein ImuB
MLFASIYVPDFIAESLARTAPELRAQPMVVLEGTPPLVRVSAVNAAARAAGVEPGMTKLQAEAMAGLVLRQRSPVQEAAAHAALLDCAHAFSPRVEPLAPAAVLLDAAGLDRLFGPPARLAREIARRASEIGLEANVAIAANRDAALLAARGFCGVTIIPPGEEAQRLGPLGCEVLFSGADDAVDDDARTRAARQRSARRQPATPAEILDTLERWGVRTLRAFAALPNIAVAERLGQQGVALQKFARGEGSQVLIAAPPPLRFEESLELEHPVALLEPLAFLLARLLDPLCARLGARALATNELRLTLQLDSSISDESTDAPRSPEDTKFSEIKIQNSKFKNDFAPSCLRGDYTLRLPVPMLDARVFLKLLQLELQERPPGAPIIAIALAAEPVRPQVAQHGLFQPAGPEPEKLQLLLARLAGVVGRENVGAAALQDSYARERFVLDCGIAEFRDCGIDAKRKTNSAIPQLSDSAILTTRIYRPPLAARVELRDGHPAGITCYDDRGFSGDVVWAAGPWRTSGEWWGANFLVETRHRGPQQARVSLAGVEHAPAPSAPSRSAAAPAPALTSAHEDSRVPKRRDLKPDPFARAPVQEVNAGGYNYPPHPAPGAKTPPQKTQPQDGRKQAASKFVSNNGNDADAPVANAALTRASLETRNKKRETPQGFDRDEWDIAIAPRLPKPIVTAAGTPLATAPPVPKLVLWRLVRDRQTGNWFVEAEYD